ncbi:unnamed protein product [Chondrus crispus]|uniref:Uncharacterized protein n=1 Tax=Chondrus crispus TaxID=2769 RepID=R7QJP6_CHOCR|nr:unnamed protein product [Chondrus crispus]CDF38742.1 unnamed protein product [Chondrus crispus]|eukprot:XP_005718647.1 unnamed protein product [Chondrus crispus]
MPSYSTFVPIPYIDVGACVGTISTSLQLCGPHETKSSKLMASFRSGRGGKNRSKPRGAGAGGGNVDFRWNKNRNKRSRYDANLHETGDSIPDDNLGNATGVAATGRKKEKKESIKERQRNAKRRRREMHERDRQESDEMIRSSPAQFLWKRYLEWARDKLTSVEKKVDRWTQEHVVSVESRDDATLIQLVKEVVGHDYIAQGEWKKKQNALPGVACIALALSALRAVYLAKGVYDGKPVGKLFSKHIKIEVQQEWLRKCCKDGLAPSAAGTAKRVQRLIEEGAMTLKHTSVLVIDFHRDDKDRNILDFPTLKEELFDFLHNHARTLIAEGKMKIVLYAPRQVENADDAEDASGKDEEQEQSE